MPNPLSTSTEVSNLHSIIKDRDSYWKNDEEFIGEVARELFKAAKSGAFITPRDQEILTQARILRRNRLYIYLAAGILFAFSIPLLCLGLGAAPRSLRSAQPWAAAKLDTIYRGNG
jgi:hypothetical protein